MIEYDDIINNSPFLINHLISLKKTHDFYINRHIKNETDIQPSQYNIFKELKKYYLKNDIQFKSATKSTISNGSV